MVWRERDGVQRRWIVPPLLLALVVGLGVGPGQAQAVAAATTTLVSVPPASVSFFLGCAGFEPSITPDGHLVAFTCNIHGIEQVFVRNLTTGRTRLVSVSSRGVAGNGDSYDPSVSADGRVVAFVSNATNLVKDANRFLADVFVHNRGTGKTTLVSVSSAGVQGNNDSGVDPPSISADGTLVAFMSNATNLVKGDTNGVADIFVHNRKTGRTTRVSVNSAGRQANQSSRQCQISADGHVVVFKSAAANLVKGDTNGHSDVFVHNRRSGKTTRVSVNSAGVQANNGSGVPAISADGRLVAFQSWATNLVAGDTNASPDVFVRDRITGETTRVSVTSAGAQANSGGSVSSISADGNVVAFESPSSNLVPGDTNGNFDVFVHDRTTGATARVSVTSTGAQANGFSGFGLAVAGDGNFVAFLSGATNLVPGPPVSGNGDVFLRGPLS